MIRIMIYGDGVKVLRDNLVMVFQKILCILKEIKFGKIYLIITIFPSLKLRVLVKELLLSYVIYITILLANGNLIGWGENNYGNLGVRP